MVVSKLFRTCSQTPLPMCTCTCKLSCLYTFCTWQKDIFKLKILVYIKLYMYIFQDRFSLDDTVKKQQNDDGFQFLHIAPYVVCNWVQLL